MIYGPKRLQGIERIKCVGMKVRIAAYMTRSEADSVIRVKVTLTELKVLDRLDG